MYYDMYYNIFRHNIQPGMVVIFIKEKLVFADWIFNGHGADFHSFQKQIQMCRTRYKEGSYFQPDYKFENVDQMVIPARRTAWGGLIYHGVETRKPEIFFQNKREMVHANTALLRLELFLEQAQAPLAGNLKTNVVLYCLYTKYGNNGILNMIPFKVERSFYAIIYFSIFCIQLITANPSEK